jgi:hypothetical protein
MNESHRYARMLVRAFGSLREDADRGNRDDLTELEIQAHWFSGDFGTEFTSARGDSVVVTQFGEWNRESGPDFATAAVSINGGPPVRGSIEIDTDARDWERHGHATNADYDSVVLHVCERDGGREFFTRNSRHGEIPRVTLEMRRLGAPPSNPLPIANLGRCSAPLRALQPGTLREVLLAAAQYRLGRKSARLAKIGELHGADEALYQALAVTLGYKNNKLPFTLIAQRLPLKSLQTAKADIDALLFGTAGFMDGVNLAKFNSETRAYLRSLWDRWWKLRDNFTRLSLAPGAWKLSSVRPANHPQRRVAALAQIVRNWRKIVALAREGDIPGIRDYFAGLRDEYWDFHYTLISKRSPVRMALVGPSRVNDMLANVFYPLAILSRPDRWKDYAKLPAPLASRRARIAATRLLGEDSGAKAILASAVNQQGLLQIYEDFCMRDNSGCAQCLFPEQIAQWQ